MEFEELAKKLDDTYSEGYEDRDKALAAISHRWDLKTPPCLV